MHTDTDEYLPRIAADAFDALRVIGAWTDLHAALSVTIASDGIRILMPTAAHLPPFAAMLLDCGMVTIAGRDYTERRGHVLGVPVVAMGVQS